MVDLAGWKALKVKRTGRPNLLQNQHLGPDLGLHTAEGELYSHRDLPGFGKCSVSAAYGVIMGPMSLATAVKEQAVALGFDMVGVAPLGSWKDLEFSKTWVERGYSGEMHYLENPKRNDPRLILPSVKSVVCVGLVYNTPLPYSTEALRAEGTRQKSGGGGPRAWISRYAWGEDYHNLLRSKLERLRAAVEALAPGVETRIYVDTGPIVERAFARYSGIGWVGKNTCLINEGKGSWFFLAVLLTSLELDPDLPAPDRCGSCTRCLEACPTGALVEPYVMDASRCIAYFTIELKGSIPPEYRPAIGANVFGCDICQDVCPWNSRDREEGLGVGSQEERAQLSAFSGQQAAEPSVRHGFRHAATTESASFQPMFVRLPVSTSAEKPPQTANSRPPAPGCRPPTLGPQTPPPAFSLFNPPLEALAAITEEDFRRIFARSPLKRAKFRGWLRNLCLAMGNSGDPRFLPWLACAREHLDPIVREHAEWAIARLQGTGNR